MSNFIEKDVCPVPKGSGAMETQNVAVTNPLPCVVIILHGVNDIGEAFENLDEGICAGLNQRLGRSDLVPNKWKITCTEPDNYSPRETIIEEGYSPIIPFFWGYRPVDKEVYKKDQQAYNRRLEERKEKDPELPYDSYWIERNIEITSEKIKKLNCDKFYNWIDSNFQRNGGPFSDATTCIPDMYGPGLEGLTAFIAKIGSSVGEKAYDNPHRIYLAYAAHRLANLIQKIREDTNYQDIPINIIAHSQGTIITMLANLIAEEKGILPADCTILAHSPYALYPSVMEQLSKRYNLSLQTAESRQETFVNFVKAIHEGQRKRKIKFTPELLKTQGVIGCASKQEKYITENGKQQEYDRVGKDKELFERNNFGKVYNYFSPNDHVVSLMSVQGIGWQGIPDDILVRCEPYGLKQRIFSHYYIVGNNTIKSEIAIPFKRYQITSKDYPEGISEQDYLKRVKIIQAENLALISLVELTQPQLDSLKNIPQFNQNSGQFLSGYYEYDSGGKMIIVQYRPSEDEFLQDNPLAQYNKITDKDLDDSCSTTEEAQQKDNNMAQKSQDSNTEETCDSASTKGKLTKGNLPYKETRVINGESVPEPFIYKVDEAGKKQTLNRNISYGDLYNNGTIDRLNKELKYTHINKPDWLSLPINKTWPQSSTSGKSILVTDQADLQRLALENEWDRGISYAKYIEVSRTGKKLYMLAVSRFLTTKELEEKITNLVKNTEDTSSHHSGITMNKLAPKHVMAYDLAIGLVKGICPTNLTLLQNWRHYADWRDPANTDKEAIEYMKKGVLPKEIKESMGYPEKHMPKTVVNKYISSCSTDAGIQAQTQELLKDKYELLSTYPKVQFYLPEPDLTTE